MNINGHEVQFINICNKFDYGLHCIVTIEDYKKTGLYPKYFHTMAGPIPVIKGYIPGIDNIIKHSEVLAIGKIMGGGV